MNEIVPTKLKELTVEKIEDLRERLILSVK
jgi:hypothetical protein